jgi:hypothetical protein
MRHPAGRVPPAYPWLNANWSPDPDGGDGRFALMIVTEDDQHYTMPASPASVSAVVASAKRRPSWSGIP